MTAWRAIVVGVALAVSVVPAASAERYVNDAYEFSVEAPVGPTFCPGGVNETSNHGVSFLIASTDCRDDGFGTERVVVFASYNVPYEVQSSREYARHICDGTRVRNSGKKVGGIAFLRCDTPPEDGLSRVKYFALRPRVGHIGILLEIHANCRPENVAGCQRVIDDVFRTLRFTR